MREFDSRVGIRKIPQRIISACEHIFVRALALGGPMVILVILSMMVVAAVVVVVAVPRCRTCCRGHRHPHSLQYSWQVSV